MLANLFTSPFYSSKSVLTHIVPVFTAGNAEWLFCDALKLAFQLPSLLLVLKNYCCVFLHTLTGIEWLESDFISRCFPMSKILRVYFLFFFFSTGKDQAYSADSDGEGTQGAANFGGTESDPTLPLIKQNIPG